ncbi:MAG: histone deacetylase [Candidatus Aminicenantes bacterium]|nr:histone deacetylase [Candidatus Aminicenantes bacterium]
MLDVKKILRTVRRKKFPFKFVYSDKYWMVDTKNHVFPMAKYRMIYETLLSRGAKQSDFLHPDFAPEDDLLLVHSSRYIRKIREGKLSSSELGVLEIPFSKELVDFFLLMVGGTVMAAENALDSGLSFHIGGGFHHAFTDHGEGFCVFNDVAVALEKMIVSERIKKALVVDCDVHQGNGTAAIFQDRDYAFTFSIHQMDIYPAKKSYSSLDVGLWSGDGDEPYLEKIRKYFPELYEKETPDLVFYLAGADPYERDQLGGLDITSEGMQERDRIIIEGARRQGIPLVILLAGGYAYDVEDTVKVHMNTINVARKAYRLHG